MTIEFETQTDIPEGLLRLAQEAADASVRQEGIRLPCAVHILLCDDETIQSYNKNYRHLDQSTDVLSFPLINYPSGKTAGECPARLEDAYDDEYNACMLGDLIISVPHALEQASAYGHSPEREFAYLLVHGLCHLMGYDHIQEDDKKKMRYTEECVLSSLGLSRITEP